MVFAALSTRSGSTRILARFGAMEARMPTTSSDLDSRDGAEPDFSSSEAFSKPIGLVVNIAVRSRRNKSCKVSDFLKVGRIFAYS